MVYALTDPRTNAVRYVGKTVNFKRRMRRYLNDQHNPHLRRWFEKLRREGVSPKGIVLETCLFGLADAERKWIAAYRAKGHRLINVTDGGEGYRITDPAALARLSERAKAAWRRPGARERFRAGIARRLGISPAEYGAKKEQKRTDRLARIQARATAREARRVAKAIERSTVPVPLTHKGAAFVPLNDRMWAIVDAAEWSRVAQHNWHASPRADRNTIRVKTTIKAGGRSHSTMLARYITAAPTGCEVRRIGRDELDFRRCNLAVVQVGSRQAKGTSQRTDG